MAFDNMTNRGRVSKMVEILDLITRSAGTNNAGADDLAQMLKPLFEVLPLNGVSAAPVEGAAPGRTGVTAPLWANVRDMAQEAPLRDLTAAMAVYLNRIDEELSQ